MAGSYNHIITDHGNLVSNERFVQMVENLGDAFETVEEMYGMIWWLATPGPHTAIMESEELVEEARKNYKVGLELARTNKRKRGPHGD